MNLPFIRINPLGILVLCAVLIFFIYLYTDRENEKQIAANRLVSLKHLLSVCVNAAELGGSKVHAVRQSLNIKQMSKGKTAEGANDPLTYGDLLSHKAMLHTIKKSFPQIEVVSEEHDGNELEPHVIGPSVSSWIPVDNFSDDIFVPMKNVLVWIDPLDATQEYTENLLEYVTTLVCVAIEGKPVIGVIHQPFQNFTVWAWDGKGTSNPTLFPRVKTSDASKPKIIVSRSHAGKVKEVARAAFGEEAEVLSAGGAGYKSLQVAEGNADAYIHVTLIKKWDICAGNALLHALGGTMTTLDGAPIQYGDSRVVKNEKGLIGALHNQDEFVKKLASLAS